MSIPSALLAGYVLAAAQLAPIASPADGKPRAASTS